MDDDAIEFHRDPGPGGPLALGVEGCGGEDDVIGLPGEGGQAHVEAWLGDGVDPSAFVVLSLEAKGVEYLGLPAAAVIDAAVPAFLPFCGGLVGGAELEVERVPLELPLAGAAGGEQVAVVDFAILPMIGRAAVEEDHGALGRFCPEGGAAAVNTR